MNENKIQSFQDLDAWKRAHELRIRIIKLTLTFPKDFQYGLTPQLQRSSISVSSNIAEGFGGASTKEKLRFYAIAEGSLTEVQDQLLLCKELELISKEEIIGLLQSTEEVHKLIRGLMRYIRAASS